MGLLEERAENLDFESLNELSSAQNLSYRLEDYFCSDEKRPIFVLGPKGSGKTFQVMKALSGAVYRKKRIRSCNVYF
jgi:DNA replication protein DnaC